MTKGSFRHRPHRLAALLWIAAVVIVAGALAFAGLVIAVRRIASGAGSALGTAFTYGVFDEGAVEAARVAELAQARHIPVGQVTVNGLQQAYPSEQWLPANESSAEPDRPYPQVSVAIDGGLVLTAARNPAGCSLGAYVVDPHDPVAVADGLQHAGTYATFGVAAGVTPPACSATAALTSGWSPVSIPRSVLRSWGRS